jgi:SCP-2 sterol transfer family
LPPFLSADWFAQATELRKDYTDLPVSPAVQGLQVNLRVTGGPDGDTEAHLAPGDGGLAIGPGFLADAPTTVILGHDVAREMFVNGNMQPAMQAFMKGEIKVEGDMTKVMALQQAGGPNPRQQELQQKIQAITD